MSEFNHTRVRSRSSTFFLTLLLVSVLPACSPYLRAVLGNKNVYKTETELKVKKAYRFSPRGIAVDTTTYIISPDSNQTLRYKVVLDEGDYKYIRVLPSTIFVANRIMFPDEDAMDTAKKYGSTEDPYNFFFQVEKKALVPNTHYMQSSALIGKIITIPARVRNDYWADHNKVLQGTLSLNYGFGMKFKIGDHPYHTHYVSAIIYAAGISAQKHFVAVNKDSTTAKTDEFAVTYLSHGIAYEYDRFNIGLFVGKDKMFGKLKNWAYQDKWWWGVGLGYDLFK